MKQTIASRQTQESSAGFARRSHFPLCIMAMSIAQVAFQYLLAREPMASNLEDTFNKQGLPAAYMQGLQIGSGKKLSYAFGKAKDGDEIYRIASMTKIVTTVAALQLVEQGKVTLDQPLNKLLPKMASAPILAGDGSTFKSDAEISLRQLLNHTSGFGYRFTSKELNDYMDRKTAAADRAAYTRVAAPGEKFCYGLSHNWVGILVEKISGKTLEQYFRDHVTGPLKMNATWFNPPATLQSRIVERYRKTDGMFQEVGPRVPAPVNSFNGGGGLFSSPNDFMRLLLCLYHGGKLDGVRILRRETVEALFSDQLPTGMVAGFPDAPTDFDATSNGGFERDLRGDRWSFGWALSRDGRQGVRSSLTAYWAGFLNCYYSVDRKKGVLVVFFCQYTPFDDEDAYSLYRAFEREVYAINGGG